MRKNLLLIALISVSTTLIYGCNSGSSSSSPSTGNTYGPYTTNGDPGVNLSVSQGSSGTISCTGTNCTLTGNASLGLGLSFSSVSPQAYFTLSPTSVSGITITPSGSNCDSNASSAPSCTYTFTCSGNGSGQFYYQLNGSAGAANVNSTPLSITCSGF